MLKLHQSLEPRLGNTPLSSPRIAMREGMNRGHG